MTASAGVEMLWTQLGRFVIGVPSEHVRRVSDVVELSGRVPPAAAVDLADRLGESLGGAEREWPRRVIEISVRGGTIVVVAGDELWPEVVAGEALMPVPALVAGPLRAAGIGRLCLAAGRFAFVLEPEALL